MKTVLMGAQWVLGVLAVVMVIAGNFDTALLLIINALMIFLFFPGRKQEEELSPREGPRRKVDVAEVKAYRKDHPDASLLEAVRAVENQ